MACVARTVVRISNIRVVRAIVLACLFACTLLAQAAQPLDINAADAATLADRLPGIGPVKAQAIVDHRKARGGFGSVDALLDVRGIGPKTLERLRPLVRVGTFYGSGLKNSPAQQNPIAAERAVRDAVQAVVRLARRDPH